MEWKPTGTVFTSVGHRWLPTGRTFAINGTKCHMTRITSNPIVPPKETSQTPVLTPNPKIKVYSRRTKVTKFISFSDEPSILGPRPSKIMKPKRDWGSTVSNSPSSSCIHCSSGLAFHETNHGTINLELVQNPSPLTPYVPPTKNDWDLLFHPTFNEYFIPPLSVVPPVLADPAPRSTDPTGSPLSTSIDQGT
nr:hypothetical protein [Tanacetum cinerariifolium]GFA05344.1 hypothetical protein [Tanacetum cinerariifolium]